MSNYFTKRQIFYINSSNRISGTDSNFTIQLDIDREEEFDQVVLLDCSIPKSYYIIQNGENTFTLQEGSTSVTITLPFGNYNRSSMKNVLVNLLNANSPNRFSYTISYQNIQYTQDTGQYTFTVTGNGSVQPSFIFGNYLYQQLGFNQNSTNNFVGNTLTSVNITNLQPEGTLFIRSDICQNYNDNILQNIITTQSADYSYIIFQNPTPHEYSKDFRQGFSNVFQFILTDEYGNEIYLNGLNLVMTIMIYKSNKIDDLIKGYIKFKVIESE